MTDERGRKRDTPNGIVGPGGTNVGHAPRGAGLSGNLPAGSRFASNERERKPGSAPISIQNEPRGDRRIHDSSEREAQGASDASRGGPWEGPPTPVRRPAPPEPPMAAPRGAATQRPPPAPAARGVDGYAATRPAEVVGGARSPSPEAPARGVGRPGGSSRPNERGAAGASPRPADPKQSLRLKLEGDTFYEANEGRVKVPKRRGPVFFGFLFVFALLAGGAFLWIDGHGGIENFVAAVKRVVDPDTAVQTSVTYGERSLDQPAASGATVAAPSGQLPTAQPGAAAPGATAQPGTAPQQPVSPSPGAQDKPVEQAAAPGQIATGEVELPDEPSAGAAQPANETGLKPQQPAEAKPKPKPIAAKPKPKPVVRRDPVLRVQPLSDVLNAAPPDPGGGAVLPPPDPPAPE